MIIRILLLLLLIILIGLTGKTYKYFAMLPESNKFKSWLACDILVFMGFIIYICIKLIIR